MPWITKCFTELGWPQLHSVQFDHFITLTYIIHSAMQNFIKIGKFSKCILSTRQTKNTIKTIFSYEKTQKEHKQG